MHWFRCNVFAACCACLTHAVAAEAPPKPSFTLEETTIAELGQRMANGELTAHIIVQQYLDRIAAIDRTSAQRRHRTQRMP